MSTERTHEDLQELMGAYALDAVDGEEREAVELHLRTCPRCRAEVADHREVAALIAFGAVPAPDGVWDKIVAALDDEAPRMRVQVDDQGNSSVLPLPGGPAPDGPGAPVSSLDAARTRRVRPVVLAALGVAAAVIIALSGVVVRLDGRVDKLKTQSAATSLDTVAGAALADPSSRRAQMKWGATDEVVPAAITKDGTGYLLAGATPTLDQKLTYQLWGIIGDTPVSLGTFPGGTRVVPFQVDPKVKTLAVTAEKAGGVSSPQHPIISSTTI